MNVKNRPNCTTASSTTCTLMSQSNYIFSCLVRPTSRSQALTSRVDPCPWVQRLRSPVTRDKGTEWKLLITCLLIVCVDSGPQNNPRYGSDAPRLRQQVDGSADSERDTTTGRQQPRNGNLIV